MIDDAIPWKQDLARVADRLERKTNQIRWTDRTCYLIERDFLVSAYAIRKLLQSDKVSNDIARQNFPVTRYASTGYLPDCMFEYELSPHYDLSNPEQWTVNLGFLCNQFIHSFVLLFSCDQETGIFSEIYVASENEIGKHVYRIEPSKYIGLCRTMSQDEIVSKSWARGADGRLVVTEILGESATKLGSQL
jgi:hypothetical protein